MRLPELQRILVEEARRQEHPAVIKRWPRLRRVRLRPMIVVLAVLLLGASATAAVVSLTRSRPLSGTLAHGPGFISPAGRTSYRISVFPYLQVGWSGWCSSIDFQGVRHVDYGCAPVETSGPLIAEAIVSDRHTSYQYEVLGDQVATVRFATGRTVVPIGDPRLPYGTRAFFTVGRSRESPRATWLDAHGTVIAQPSSASAGTVGHLPLRRLNPRRPGSAACAVKARPLAGLSALTETVVAPAPWPRPQAGALLACANATFRLARSQLAVAVLVDATNARRPAPALPGLQPDPAHPGILIGSQLGSIGLSQGLAGGLVGSDGPPSPTPTGAQALSDRDVSARRAGPAWLVAEGGTPSQRATLLTAVSTSS